eukprot:TRINITY_DN3257_c0_g1_i2.p1 TRINITY_DN3257_c0_g1~~TRINITY_DN3257_c0_g1_i2.p1  ORF type:complete len:264 (+),score=46.45 TRINITY_DN3257_c0_g1_i2:90-881(+)
MEEINTTQDVKMEDVLFSDQNIRDVHKPVDLMKPQRSVRFSSHQDPVERTGPYKRINRAERKQHSTARRLMRNNIELLETALSDSEGEDLEIEVEYVVEYKSPFAVVFENDDLRQAMDPLMDCTEVEQARILHMMCGEDDAFRGKKTCAADLPRTDPKHCWYNLSKYSRSTLRKQYGSQTLKEIEEDMVKFLLNRDVQKTTMFFEEHFDHFICHCMAPYYYINASTVQNANGTYTTTLKKTHNAVLPDMKLTQYLKQCRHKKL